MFDDNIDRTFFFFYALIFPLVIVGVRDQIRRTRFKATTEIEAYLGPKFPSLVFVLSKYGDYSSVVQPGAPGPRVSRSDWRENVSVFLAAILYSLVTAVGWLFVAFAGASASTCPSSDTTISTCAAIWNASAVFAGTAGSHSVSQTIAVAAFAFLGAYVFSIRHLIRGLMNYEVTPLTLLRATSHIVIGVVVALVIWHSAIQLVPQALAALGDRVWLAIAFFIGFVPEYAVNAAGRQLDFWTFRLGSRDLPRGDFGAIPLEILDGIDMWTRFRLEESRIEDVQNLATCNPIELYVDTPYGFLEVIDWVLQAQLCAGVGPNAFLKLRQLHIRTIFDFERAVFDPHASNELLQGVGRIVISECDSSIFQGAAHDGERPASTPISPDLIRHLGRIIIDDIHVHRLRQIWNLVRNAFKEENEWMDFSSRPFSERTAQRPS